MKVVLLLIICSLAISQKGLPALGQPKNPKVKIDWTRYYSSKEINQIVRKLVNAHPKFARMERAGRSEMGKPINAIIITDFSTEKDTTKPGVYADGNIHSNEIQGSEVLLYTAWYLLEMRSQNDFVKDLLKKKSFYFLPSINMDARDDFLFKPNTPHSPRTGMKPLDDDMDGSFNEDPPNDLNGDGFITQMIKKNPFGRWRKNRDFPSVLERVKPDEFGDYDLYRSEGYDDDGDGRINEDGNGYYDPNRDYAWYWEAKYVQRGAYKYPFSIQDSRAVHKIVNKYPNILTGFSFHNSGGIFLHGPAVVGDDSYNRSDVAIYKFVGDFGVDLVPAYYRGTSLKNMYSVYGGTKDWLFAGKGIYGWTVELWSSQNLFRKKDVKNAYAKFSKEVLLGDGYVKWEKFNHPTLGEIEIGGQKKFYGRVPPAFLLQEELHRNAMFVLWNGYHLAELNITDIETKKLSDSVYEITATLYNNKRFPTRSKHDVENSITAPDLISIYGKSIKVLSGGVVTSDASETLHEQELDPRSIKVDRFDGFESKKVRWIVKGSGLITVSSKSVKGGQSKKSERLK